MFLDSLVNIIKRVKVGQVENLDLDVINIYSAIIVFMPMIFIFNFKGLYALCRYIYAVPLKSFIRNYEI